MARIIGCNSLHIAEVTKDDKTGVTFGTPKSVPAVISVDIKDNADSTTFYSDDVAEEVINNLSSKEVSIELGYLSPELEATITGNTYENGIFRQNASAVAKNFALLFKAPLSGGNESQYVCLYKGVLSRTDATYKTKEDGIDGQTVSLSGTFMPLTFNGETYCKANSGDRENSAVIAKWFTQVPAPVGASQPASATVKERVSK